MQQNPPRGRPWRKGQSGNPAGRPPGSRNRETRLRELLLTGKITTDEIIDRVLAGDDTALAVCVKLICRPEAPARRRVRLAPLS
ncbi:MAG TPA: DUF5681 domain-containing protein [Stellaceae bacterium]|jgi:hypothetical protein|nr:DUF5681 domain-containing protein [Stellaceae bacterium]